MNTKRGPPIASPTVQHWTAPSTKKKPKQQTGKVTHGFWDSLNQAKKARNRQSTAAGKAATKQRGPPLAIPTVASTKKKPKPQTQAKKERNRLPTAARKVATKQARKTPYPKSRGVQDLCRAKRNRKRVALATRRGAKRHEVAEEGRQRRFERWQKRGYAVVGTTPVESSFTPWYTRVCACVLQEC